MKLQGIHHHSVLVSDMERAVVFYRDVLGLQVWTNGTEIPIAVVGGTGGMLTGATLRFIGHASTSRFTSETVYWLSHDTTAGLRGPVALAPEDALRWDEDTVYDSLFAGPTGDRWFGREVQAGHTVTATLTLPTSVPNSLPTWC